MEFNSKFGKIVGGLLIAVGILSVIFNAADLGAGMSTKAARNAIYDEETGKLISMSDKSLGIAAHGFWCGILVRAFRLCISQGSVATCLRCVEKFNVRFVGGI